MSPRHAIRVLLACFLVMVGLAPIATLAQVASPVAEPAPPVVVASGLTNPRGMTWGADGTLFVALAGSGGNTPATEDAPTTAAIGPFTGGPTGAVAQIVDGCPVGVATGLPSTMSGMGDVLGAEDVAILGDQLYAAVDGGGPVHGNADAPSGVYRILADGTTELVADLSAWVRENPVAEVPGDYDPDGAGYTIVADEAAGLLWVGDPNSGQVLSVTADGVIARVADLSAGHPVPTHLTADPEGGVYVGTLTVVPFTDGTAKVMHVAADGTVTDVWTGLTTVVDVAVGADGTLYALEMSTGNLAEPPFLQPGSGRVVQQTAPDGLEVVVNGLMFPIALDTGPDGAFYVASPAIGANGGEGVVTWHDPSGALEAPATTGATCAPLPETVTALPADDVPAAPSASPVAEAPVAAGEVAVAIQDFTFVDGTLEIAAGTTVTWTNNDSAPHTATADDGSFDTGTIDSGASASVTFDTPGTFTYICAFHPNMTATIVVT